jgi:hypothetical protein
MVISEISPKVLNYYRKLDGYIVPEWVKMRINIDRPLSEICHRNNSDFSEVQRRIRKYNLTPELLYDKKSVDDFYDKFYLPYLTKRHGEEAWIEDINIIREDSRTSFILAVKENGVTAGSCLVRKTPEALFLTRLGLLEGNEEYRRHGVIGAIYYFCVVEGQKLGCRYLELGGTRPFLTDGLTKFKSGLGAEFVSNLNHYNEYLWIGVNEHSAVAQEYIKNNPVIYIKKDFDLMRSGT